MRPEENEELDLSVWTIYAHPKDYPDCYVARRFVITTPTEDVLIAPTLEELRELLPKGLCRMPRTHFDDVNILEVWL